MFVGFIRDNFASDIETLSQEDIIIDNNLALNTREKYPLLSFGAYDNTKLSAFIGAYEFDKIVLINSFYYKNIDENVKDRLIKILINNLHSTKSLLVLANQNEIVHFQKLGFDFLFEFKQAYYNGDGVAFNFSNAMAKSINSDQYLKHIKELDYGLYLDDRFEYITQMMAKKTSLILSNEYGYQHSYTINNSLLKLSPWVVKEESYSEAEKFMRGVLHYRGLKKIVAMIPNIDDIKELYRYYKFDIKDTYYLMYLNDKPNINFNKVYSF